MYKIRPGVLSTMGHPYGLDHIDRLAAAGVEVIVCALTEAELGELGLVDEREAARDAGITFHWIPIPDFGVPATTPDLSPVLRDLRAGRHVLAHCWGGIGRTGTAVGCHLVRTGQTGAEALATIAGLWQGVSED